MSVLFPGFGHVLFGHSVLGLSLLVSAYLIVLVLSYIAAWGTWALAIAVLVNLGFYILSLLTLIKKTRQPLKVSALMATITLIFSYSFIQDWRRVQVKEQTSALMEPEILIGDSLAIDTLKSTRQHLKKGDIVAVFFPGRPGSYLRKVDAVNEKSITVSGNQLDVPREEVVLENIYGRILYVVYSYDRDKKSIRWERTLSEVTQ